MSVPLISLILGIIILSLTLLAYQGHSIFSNIPLIFNLKKDKFFLLSFSCISLGLMLGIIGEIIKVNPSVLRTIRFFMIAAGGYFISLLLVQSIQSLERLFPQYFLINKLFKSQQWLSTIYTVSGMIIFYIIVLGFLLFFGDRVGWEGDDIDQLEGIINFSYKGKNLIYRYYWQPLTYELNIWLHAWLNRPKFLFVIPQIIGAANICLLFLAVYIFAEKRLNLILCFCFLIIFPEIIFSSLYYNSTVFAMFPMTITILFLFWSKSSIKKVNSWNNFRYFVIGFTSTLAVFFRLDFLLSLPLLWYLMLFDTSLSHRFKNRLIPYFIYILTSFMLLVIFSITDIFNLQQIIYITNSHEQGANTWTIQQSLANLFSVTNLVIWIILITSLIYFTVTNIKKKNWRFILLFLCILILLYPLPSLTSPKYLIPGIIFLPFVLATITLRIKSTLETLKFKTLTLGFIILTFFLQLVTIQWVMKIPFIEVTATPSQTNTHDGMRVSGAYLKGYNQVRKAQTISPHPPIKFSRKMAEVIQKINNNVTVIYLDKANSISSEVWIRTFTTFYLELEGYQIQYYDRKNEIVLLLGDKKVIMKKVNEKQYKNYLNLDQEKTTVIKVPDVSREDPQRLKKFFEDFYNDLDKIA